MKHNPAPKLDSFFSLLLIRHGSAAPKNAGLSDFERILTKKGITECHYSVSELTKKNIPLDLLLSSPADRALETAHLFAREFGYPIQKIQIANALYASTSIIPTLTRLKQLSDFAKSAAIFGHNPLLEELAAFFIPGFSRSIPKGGIVAISFNIKTWAQLKNGAGQLQFIISLPDRKKPTNLPGLKPSIDRPTH